MYNKPTTSYILLFLRKFLETIYGYLASKNLIFDQNFGFRPIIWFLTKILIFDQHFYFRPKFWFSTKFWFFTATCISVLDLNIRFYVKILILYQNFDHSFDQIAILNVYSDFWRFFFWTFSILFNQNLKKISNVVVCRTCP